MDVLVMIGQLLLGLSILVVLHELGHFWAARAFGIKVEKFYLFFDAWGFKLFSINYKGVEYGIGWLPLGGYVKIAGMIDESMDTEQMKQEPQPWEFRSKPAWQRLIVMLGGVTVNIILGIFIFWMMTFKYGESYIPNSALKYGIAPGIVGKEVGFKAGDKVVAINGTPLVKYNDLMSSDVILGNSVITIVRDGKEKDLTIPSGLLNTISDYGMQEFVAPRTKFTVDSIVSGMPASKAGLQKGDVILTANGEETIFFDQLQAVLKGNPNKNIELSVRRKGEDLTLPVTVSSEGTLGFLPKFDSIPVETEYYGFFQSLPIGASKAWTSLVDNAKGLGKVVKGEVKANKAFSGPVEIARKLYGGTWDWVKFWNITGLLSMALALMNLLPIPALDGGHSLFLLIEMIKGKPLSDKFMEKAQIVGFVLLATLMVFVLGNDIFKAFTK
ncbi:site-2 protease [Pseudopedobacter saltans DSM 12145]|uniref:Zinc metalloprotease n=1 Tax=Pseudopedobacter saltans (strain ATCC 51119 / DSM 12145 / JCM 21818 / CCUG 39354 / LMG 10337 / NBRC 100064 / NCIMB 13643) TaxID=762903 RepID=F0S7G8_PSESL|nr:RIP metalloprotease RseP [Pseudopedobacter saltans]ADY51193.1 site-2 protease [Pseudopedobacter saltans DSM 12145]